MADVTTTFAAKDENFAKTIDGLQKKMDGFSKQMEGFSGVVGNVGSSLMGVAGKLAGFAAGFVAVQAVVGAFKDAIDMGGQLNDLSARTGETAGNLMILQRAFENAGVGADSVGQQLNKLQRFMYEARDASSEQGKTLVTLGLTYDELRGKAPIEQMQLLAEKIAGIQDPGERAAMAMAVFGKSGGELIPLLRGMTDGIDQAKAQLGGAPDAINATAKALDDIGDNLNAASQKAKEFALGLLVDLAPALVDISQKLATIDAASFGAIIGGYVKKTLEWISATLQLGSTLDGIKTAIDSIASGNFAQGFELLFLTAKNYGLNMVNVIAAAAFASIQTVMDALSTVFGINSGFVKLATSTFSYISKIFESNMASDIATIMEGIPFISGAAVDSMRMLSRAADVEATAMTYYMSDAANQIKSDLGNAFANGPAQFAKHFQSNMRDPLIKIEDSIKRQNELQSELNKKLKETAFKETEVGKAIDANNRKKMDQLAGVTGGFAGMTDAQAAAEIAKTAGGKAPGIFGMTAEQVAAAQSAAAAIPGDGGGGGGGGGGAGRTTIPQSEIEKLKASGTVGSLADAMRIADQKAKAEQVAAMQAAKGHYTTAASTLQRAEDRANRAAENARLKDIARQSGFSNFNQMFNEANKQMPIKGKLNKEEYAKTLLGPDSQQKEDENNRNKKAADAENKNKMIQTESTGELKKLTKVVEDISKWMKKNLPSNAMT